MTYTISQLLNISLVQMLTYLYAVYWLVMLNNIIFLQHLDAVVLYTESSNSGVRQLTTQKP